MREFRLQNSALDRDNDDLAKLADMQTDQTRADACRS
jgi:hypothetical protein